MGVTAPSPTRLGRKLGQCGGAPGPTHVDTDTHPLCTSYLRPNPPPSPSIHPRPPHPRALQPPSHQPITPSPTVPPILNPYARSSSWSTGPLILGKLQPPRDLAVFQVRSRGSEIEALLDLNLKAQFESTCIIFVCERHTLVIGLCADVNAAMVLSPSLSSCAVLLCRQAISHRQPFLFPQTGKYWAGLLDAQGKATGA